MGVEAGTVLELQAAVLSRRRFEEAAATFATQLSQRFGLDRAAIGFLEDGYARVVAVSHGAAVDGHEFHRGVAAAMDEAIDQAATVRHPPLESRQPRITLCHAALARQNASAVCSIPLVEFDTVVGAVTIEGGTERALNEEDIEACEHVVALVGPVLAMKRRDETPWTARARQRLRETGARLLRSGDLKLKVSVAAAAGVVVVTGFIPLPYTVTAPARLEGSVQRAVVAATDGFIQQVAVRPGDAVRQGQILAELAQQDLMLERSKWESELAQQLNAYGAALARADRPLLMVNHAKAAEARAQLELIEKQIERAQLRAPFDGVVISGDLTQSLGAPVRRGDTLMVLAPREGHRLIVEVDERDIIDVRTGARGRVALAALPAQPFAFQVQRVTPVSTTKDGRHYFEVEGKLSAEESALRPGLQGIARIQAEPRPFASRMLGRALNWLRMKLWSWGWWS